MFEIRPLCSIPRLCFISLPCVFVPGNNRLPRLVTPRDHHLTRILFIILYSSIPSNRQTSRIMRVGNSCSKKKIQISDFHHDSLPKFACTYLKLCLSSFFNSNTQYHLFKSIAEMIIFIFRNQKYRSRYIKNFSHTFTIHYKYLSNITYFIIIHNTYYIVVESSALLFVIIIIIVRSPVAARGIYMPNIIYYIYIIVL